MAFTDEDLNNLREDTFRKGLIATPTAILGLIQRLEAAERVCEWVLGLHEDSRNPFINEELGAWRKSKGA